ncbi:GNAT family N-acetyltransferase [Paenibacillus nanensis]|uniref:GNAT family N-acetyltransferase n=1 Tax=Paenibacillus nanensis TaxID=393251 RepID=A0A3A1UYR0_9BACL|nr:GNAT family N-acetyltransferase [Paenibacillus nanensis]RIX51503.1 GNAT family N-acetyltransferase [Paenibacillus nanensis]
MIVQLNHSNKKDYNKSNDGFMVTGRLLPRYENGNWTYREETYSEPYFKEYELEEVDTSYIGGTDKAVYLYYVGGCCVGQIRLRGNWNGFAMIEDICVARDWRQKGVGSALLDKAEEWARQKGYLGLMLETQDVNVSACRFYAKNGFVIGAVDTMLYSNFSTADEIAIYWYRRF